MSIAAAPSERLLGAVAAVTGGAPGEADAAGLPRAPGAYLLLIGLARPLPLKLPSLPSAVLPAGWYLYGGSARGPGGIRARLSRHLARHGRLHWHVDHLTAAAASLRGFPVPGGDECALLRDVYRRAAVEIPVPGFGSSDCRRCKSHLLLAVAPRDLP